MIIDQLTTIVDSKLDEQEKLLKYLIKNHKCPDSVRRYQKTLEKVQIQKQIRVNKGKP